MYVCACVYIYIYIHIFKEPFASLGLGQCGLRFDRFDFRTVRYLGFDIASTFPQAGTNMLSQVRVLRFGFDRFGFV